MFVENNLFFLKEKISSFYKVHQNESKIIDVVFEKRPCNKNFGKERIRAFVCIGLSFNKLSFCRLSQKAKIANQSILAQKLPRIIQVKVE